MRTTTPFDYIVVGAGTSGCVIAGRLSERASVLLLEAGGPDTAADVREVIHRPQDVLRAIRTPAITQPYSTEPQAGLGGRAIAIHRGIVRGGSSTVNGMIYVRGNRRDYDHWARLGNEGWSFEDVLPLFKRSEDLDRRSGRYAKDDLAYHGSGGPLAVRRLPDPSPVARAFVEAAAELGYHGSGLEWDFNGRQQEDGAGLYQVTVDRGGRRASAATAFLDPVARRRRLTVRTGARAIRLHIEGGRAAAVQCLESGTERTYRAEREVILAAGAFESPRLLMLSGIGPADELRARGVEPLVDLPGVGQNLHDHLMVLLYFLASKRPGAAGFIAEAGLFTRVVNRSRAATPDLQYHALAGMPGLAVDPASVPNFLLCPTLCQPLSRGHVRLRTADPLAPLLIEPGYLAREADVRVLVRGIELAGELARTRALGAFRRHREPPFAVTLAGRLPVPARSASSLRDFVRASATTVWHPVGTCRMGRDALAVVDARLRVHGVEGLRVADAAVIPAIPSANTNAACVMIGEKCAALLRGDALGDRDDAARRPPAGRSRSTRARSRRGASA